jgi:hypothetical protein
MVSVVFDNVMGSPLCGSGNASVDNVTDTDADPGGCNGGLSLVVHEFASVAEPEIVVWAAAPALPTTPGDTTTHAVMSATPASRRRVLPLRLVRSFAIREPPGSSRP